MTTVLLLLVLGLEAAAALAALLMPGRQAARRSSLALVAAAGAVALVVAGAVLAGAARPAIVIESGLPLGPLRLGLDPLSAFFLGLVGLLLAPAAIYAEGYLGAEGEHAPIRAHVALVTLLAAAMTLVVSAQDGITFLIGWELLAWSSYLAVVLEVDDRETGRAAFLMLAVSELGSFGLVAAILVLGNGHFGFASLAAGGASLPEPVRSLVFLGLVAGFGAKAGLMPLQLWLPEAHPAAPTHVSAILSAVIVKLGIYGLIRFGLEFLPHPAAWWGPALVALGAITAVTGILWALFQRDVKRLLAYSTIENVGIIVAAIGLAETFRAGGIAVLASITLVVALYQVLAHGLAKGLLFLGAGSVARATGTRDLERLGGLIHRLRFTAGAMLVGSLSIAAVAPFAGYLGEWMVLETFLQGFRLPELAVRVVVVAAGALLALTAATAVMAFVRLFAIGFVGLPRSRGAADAVEGPRSMRVAMAALLAVLLLVGFLPTIILPILDRAALGVVGPSAIAHLVPAVFTGQPGAYAPLVGLGGGLFGGLLPVQGLIVIPAPGLTTINSPTYLTLAELIGLALVALAVSRVPRLGADRRAPVWAGGIPRFLPSMQYTALAYANPVRLIFHIAVRSRVVSAPARAAVGGMEGVAYGQDVPAPLEESLYAPIRAFVSRVAARVKVLQSGDINQYVAYIFAIVLLVLVLRVI